MQRIAKLDPFATLDRSCNALTRLQRHHDNDCDHGKDGDGNDDDDDVGHDEHDRDDGHE